MAMAQIVVRLSLIFAIIASASALSALSSTKSMGQPSASTEPSKLPADSGKRLLKVGPGEMYPVPSAAANAALPGDRIAIAAGTYHDCAIWRAGQLTIIGLGNVVLANTVCRGQAIFVTLGQDITVRGITFTGARVRAHNGAGIRAEGANLTVEMSKFIDNEEGILSSSRDDSTIVIRDSYFKGNGTCESACAHGIYVGHISTLRIERSEFVEQHVGHHVKSRALRTELFDNVIRDGSNGNSSYLVDIPDGGTLVMSGNVLEKGPHTDNAGAAVVLGEESTTNPTSEIVIENNVFSNRLDRSTVFVRNATKTAARLRANRLMGNIIALAGPGSDATR